MSYFPKEAEIKLSILLRFFYLLSRKSNIFVLLFGNSIVDNGIAYRFTEEY